MTYLPRDAMIVSFAQPITEGLFNPSHGPPRGVLTVSVNHTTISPLLLGPFQLYFCSVLFDLGGLHSLCLWGGYVHLYDLLQSSNALAQLVSLAIRLMFSNGGSTD